MKNIKIILIFSLAFILASCSQEEVNTYDVGIVSDKSIEDYPPLNQIQAGVSELGETFTSSVRVGDDQAAYISAMNAFIENEYELIALTSFIQNPALNVVASENPDKTFLIFDSIIDPIKENVVSVSFKDQEGAFLAGYLAGLKTQSNKVGYIGHESDIVSDKYEYGFRYGLLYAAKELDKEIGLKVEYLDSFSDFEQGKEKADLIYELGTDIIYQVAGYSGHGIIESAKEFNRYVISDGEDQAFLAPENVLTSIVRDYKAVSSNLILDISQGNLDSGKLYVGLGENALGLVDQTENSILEQDLYNKVSAVKELIIKGEIQVPFDSTSFQQINQ